MAKIRLYEDNPKATTKLKTSGAKIRLYDSKPEAPSVVDQFLKQNPPLLGETRISQAPEKPVPFGWAGQAGKAAFDVTKNTIEGAAQRATDFFDISGGKSLNALEQAPGFSKYDSTGKLNPNFDKEFKAHQDYIDKLHVSTPLERATKLGQAGVGVANIGFLPVTAQMEAAKEVPILKYPAKGASWAFNELGKLGSWALGKGVDVLPISDETKTTIRPLAEEVGAFVAQLVGVKVAHGVATKGLALKSLPISKETKGKISTAAQLTVGLSVTPFSTAYGLASAKIAAKVADRQAKGIEITPEESKKIIEEVKQELPKEVDAVVHGENTQAVPEEKIPIRLYEDKAPTPKARETTVDLNPPKDEITAVKSEAKQLADYVKERRGNETPARQKGIAMEFAAIERGLEGRPSTIEFNNGKKYLESNYVGKPVTVGDQAGTLGKTAFGKTEVKFDDGTSKFLNRDQIKSAPITKADVMEHLKQKAQSTLDGQKQIYSGFKLKEASAPKTPKIRLVEEPLPNELQVLATESRQYKSAQEFADSLTKLAKVPEDMLARTKKGVKFDRVGYETAMDAWRNHPLNRYGADYFRAGFGPDMASLERFYEQAKRQSVKSTPKAEIPKEAPKSQGLEKIASKAKDLIASKDIKGLEALNEMLNEVTKTLPKDSEAIIQSAQELQKNIKEAIKTIQSAPETTQNGVTKELQPLAEEAKKFKSVEDFIQSVRLNSILESAKERLIKLENYDNPEEVKARAEKDIELAKKELDQLPENKLWRETSDLLEKANKGKEGGWFDYAREFYKQATESVQPESKPTQESQTTPKTESKVNPEQTKFQSRVYDRLKAEHPDILTDEAGYENIKLKEDAQRAVELLAKDKAQAYRIAMGAEASPDVTSTAVNIAMAEQALTEGNNSLYSQLVKNRSFEQTRRGQEIVAEKGSVTDNSTSRYVKELLQARLENAGKKYLDNLKELIGKKTSTKEKAQAKITAEVKIAKEKISNKELDMKEAQSLIDRLACK